MQLCIKTAIKLSKGRWNSRKFALIPLEGAATVTSGLSEFAPGWRWNIRLQPPLEGVSTAATERCEGLPVISSR